MDRAEFYQGDYFEILHFRIDNLWILCSESEYFNHINIDNEKDWGTQGIFYGTHFPEWIYNKSNPENFTSIRVKKVRNQINFTEPNLIPLLKNLDVWVMGKGSGEVLVHQYQYDNHIVKRWRTYTTNHQKKPARQAINQSQMKSQKKKIRKTICFIPGPNARSLL